MSTKRRRWRDEKLCGIAIAQKQMPEEFGVEEGHGDRHSGRTYSESSVNVCRLELMCVSALEIICWDWWDIIGQGVCSLFSSLHDADHVLDSFTEACNYRHSRSLSLLVYRSIHSSCSSRQNSSFQGVLEVRYQ